VSYAKIIGKVFHTSLPPQSWKRDGRSTCETSKMNNEKNSYAFFSLVVIYFKSTINPTIINVVPVTFFVWRLCIGQYIGLRVGLRVTQTRGEVTLFSLLIMYLKRNSYNTNLLQLNILFCSQF